MKKNVANSTSSQSSNKEGKGADFLESFRFDFPSLDGKRVKGVSVTKGDKLCRLASPEPSEITVPQLIGQWS
jgi:hypothetical protein